MSNLTIVGCSGFSGVSGANVEVSVEQNIQPINQYTNIPPRETLERNEFGLLKNTNYVFGEDGYINWRKMLKPIHLAPDKNKTKETDVSQLDDSKLIILKSGIQYLAFLRGYIKVGYKSSASLGYVHTTCRITWCGNYETNNREIIFEACADASKENTDEGIASIYLAAIAENRAFARCVRNFLRIGIVAEEETKESQAASGEGISTNPTSLFKELMVATGFTFQQIKKKMISERKEGAETWNNEEDIPKPILFEIISRMQDKINGKSVQTT